jgi:hypothetical protein
MKEQLGNNYYNKIASHLDYETYDLLLTDINAALFDYSDHHLSNKLSYKSKIKLFLLSKFFFIFYFKNKLKAQYQGKSIIVSNAYITVNNPSSITLLPPWVFSLKKASFGNWKISIIARQLNAMLRKKSIRLLLSDKFKQLKEEFKAELKKLFVQHKILAVIVPNDMAFFEKLALQSARESGIPSFVYLHGLPGRYNNIDDNRADYLIVWGEGLKALYINAGVKEDKIITLQHPFYSSFKAINLQSNLSNVLVLTKATCGVPSDSSKLILSDRSTVLHYTELVKENLKKLGIKKAILRLHPSEDKDFYLKNLIDDFFIIDKLSKDESLSKATLVVGPTSTMVLDAIKAGKNYILFDPVFDDGITLEGIPLVSPFNGDSFIKTSNNAEEMQYNISHPEHNINFEKLNDFFSIDLNDKERFLNLINAY